MLVAVTTMIRTRYGGPVDCSWCSRAAWTPQGVQKLHPLLTAGGLQMFRTLDQAGRAAPDHREHPSGSAAGVGCARADRAAENGLAAAGTSTEGKRSSSRPTRNKGQLPTHII